MPKRSKTGMLFVALMENTDWSRQMDASICLITEKYSHWKRIIIFISEESVEGLEIM